MVNELKPCPLCGSPAHFDDAGIEHDLKQYSIWSVWCDNEDECGCCTGDFDTKEEAAAVWNRRAERTCRMKVHAATCMRICSECGAAYGIFVKTPYDFKAPSYCPNCGARVVQEITP